MRVAAIDVGTNTVRLLVAEGSRSIERASRITRLGEGVDATGELGDLPMKRTLEAIADFFQAARATGAQRIRIAGTSALRDARNRSVFGDKVLETCGEPLEILRGDQEGKLAYAGATGWLGEDSYVVCDIGGGSTELISADDVISADLGSVRIRERYLEGDPPTPRSVGEARSAIRGILVGLDAPGRMRMGHLVGVAGTITTLAALDAGLAAYDSKVVHDYLLTIDVVYRWTAELNGLSADEVKALGPVAPGREDVIGAGTLILATVMEMLDRQTLTVSEKDILDGLVQDLVG